MSTGGGVRIWHQSITDLSLQRNYATTLRAQAARVIAPGSDLVVHGVRPGTYPAGMSAGQVIRHPWADYLLNVQIIENVRQAELDGFDVVACSCWLDPGLEVARSAVDIPVVSICESALAQAMPFGRRYGLVCLDEDVAELLRENVAAYGFTSRVAGVVSVHPELTGLQLEGAYDDLGVIAPSLETATAELRRSGADLLIPAEGILNTLFTHHGVTEFGGLPVFDAYAALVMQAELTVALRRRSGVEVSHVLRRRRPPARVVDSMREATAAVLGGPDTETAQTARTARTARTAESSEMTEMRP